MRFGTKYGEINEKIMKKFIHDDFAKSSKLFFG